MAEDVVAVSHESQAYDYILKIASSLSDELLALDREPEPVAVYCDLVPEKDLSHLHVVAVSPENGQDKNDEYQCKQDD